ncbi:hypothetical protein [Aquimarina sp. 2201CG14-23]|uniref:hypothetical protein n=1 Tax=Aquimarina mycalae TaxID=3040073 RepID=UPI00247818C1|nr:hypothetical protein [Aquimarina sp. 2201CG14-23]MDH7447351.1 hypothetical protein [Aquimarina sp. 2201CG14-23]
MKKIKIIAMIILSSCLTSCLSDDAGINFFYELVPIEQVEIPDQFVRGETVTITVSYFRPSDCHSFSGFDYDRVSNERTVSAVNVVVNDRVCEDLVQTDLVEASFDFFVGFEDSYVFRFWQGRNDQGENQFLIMEVPVVE